MSSVFRNTGSFRDPSGYVYQYDGRIFRTIRPYAAARFNLLRSAGILDALVARGLLLPFQDAPRDIAWDITSGDKNQLVVEHPRLPFISYPYEWSFEGLKRAALLHLEFHLSALELNASLADASAYNIQFRGPHPIFIDHLSLCPYQEGDLWMGQRQFCEQFLAPLLLYAACGVIPNPWYRGTQEGIYLEDIIQLLPLRWRLRPSVLGNIVLPVHAQRIATRQRLRMTKDHIPSPLPKRSLINILRQLQNLIHGLNSKNDRSTWSDYTDNHTYGTDELIAKQLFITRFISEYQPQTLWDMGCNTGFFSKTAIKAGVKIAVGFDSDMGALNRAFSLAREENIDLLPLYLDAANPSPSQGWNQAEREGLAQRGNADALLALAFLHHLAISRNIPLDDAVAWLMALAPRGVIEFVPLDDPTIRLMLSHRDKTLFSGYHEDVFVRAVTSRGRILTSEVVSNTGRRLYAYERQN